MIILIDFSCQDDRPATDGSKLLLTIGHDFYSKKTGAIPDCLLSY